MASVSWTATTSGTWSVASNWGGTAPLRGDDVTIAPQNASSITVTYTSGTLQLNTLNAANMVTLDLTGGLLSVINGYDLEGNLTLAGGSMRVFQAGRLNGGLNESAGTLTFLRNGSVNGSVLVQTGGTISIAHGTFTDASNSATLAGTVSGNGEIVFANNNNGTTTLANGFALSTGSAEVQQGTTVLLQENLKYGGIFTLQNGAAFDTQGNLLTLNGFAALGGDMRSGTVSALGGGRMDGLTVDNGANILLGSNTGTQTASFVQTGNIGLGNAGSGTLTINQLGSLRMTGNQNISGGSGTGTLINNGLLTKAGGGSAGGTSTISAWLVNTGTINVATGALDLQGPNNGATTLGGTIAGAGSIIFDTGAYNIYAGSPFSLGVARTVLENSANITLTTSLSYAGSFDQIGGTLAVGSPGIGTGSLTLSGETALDNGLIKGTGTVLASGAVSLGNNMQLEGNVTFDFAAPVTQTGSIYLGHLADAITNAIVEAGDSWLMEGNAGITGTNGTITNHGLFAKFSGGGTSVVQTSINNLGTLAVDTGALVLSGQGTLGGTVNGGGVLDISGAYAFASGLMLSVGEVILDQPSNGGVQASLGGNLTFKNVWAQEGGTLSLNGNSLTLSGTSTINSGAMIGAGQVTLSGPALLGNISLAQGIRLQANGATEQSGNVTLTSGSSAPTLSIGANGTYTLDSGVYLGGPNNSISGSVTVAGTFAASQIGTTTINAAVTDNGTIALNYGEMKFLGSVTGTGAIDISHGGRLDLLAMTPTSTGVTFGTGGGLLELGTPGAFHGTIAGFASGDGIELNGFAFSSRDTDLISNNNTLTVSDTQGDSVSLTFSSTTTLSTASLLLGVGPHGGLTLFHI